MQKALEKKIYIIAGEASGDNIGARLMHQLSKLHPLISFYGIGGSKMIEGGIDSLFPIDELSHMGIFEILPHIFHIKKLIENTVDNIQTINPDIVITIDSPGFCYRVAKILRKSGYKGKLLHIVAPSVWVYKPGRAALFAKIYDHLLTLLPFEPPYFQKEGLDSTYIGHPIFEEEYGNDTSFRERHNIPKQEFLLLVTPGSRRGELKRHLPSFVGALNDLASNNDFTACFVMNGNIDLLELYLSDAKFKYIVVSNDEKIGAYGASNLALAKSGTNTLEIAASKVPMIVAYKLNFLTGLIIKMTAKIKYASLINIIANKEIIPEFLQSKCNKNDIANALQKMISDKEAQKIQVLEANKILTKMGLGSKEKPSKIAAKVVMSLI